MLALCLAAVAALSAEARSQASILLAQATVERSEPDLPPSNYELAAKDTIFVWRDLDSGKVTKEYVKEHVGRLMQSNFGIRRSFAYVPDPWADDENTKEADIEPLFPLEVGKKVSFYRQPRAGRTHDTVEVVRTETLTLPFGRSSKFSSHSAAFAASLARHRTQRRAPVDFRRAGAPRCRAAFRKSAPRYALPVSFCAILATCSPWKRAIESSPSLGWRLPSPPAMVLAP
jgi:hypothetical protein